MPSFSKKSQFQLSTCDSQRQELFNEVIKTYDCTIIEGYRPLDIQQELYNTGKSKVRQGKHNQSPSQAVDAAPYIEGRGIPWPQTPDFVDWLSDDERRAFNAYIKDMGQFYHFAGYVEGKATEMGQPIRWGGDWDRDHCFADQDFDDLVHFESDARYI